MRSGLGREVSKKLLKKFRFEVWIGRKEDVIIFLFVFFIIEVLGFVVCIVD